MPGRRPLRWLWTVLLPTVAAATGPALPPVVIVPGTPFPITTSCWVEPHYFDSLRTGPIEYCRKNLRYRPGRPECMTVTDRVCTVWYPDLRDWGETRSSGEWHVIACPDGDEPPVCPRLGVPRTLGSGWPH